MGQYEGLHGRTGREGSGGPHGQYAVRPAGWIYVNATEVYGTSAETSAELVLSTLLELTDVTT
jgi:hypothetical protein